MKSICILLTDHQSINDLILLKSYNRLKKNRLHKIYFIGDKKKFKNAFNISKKIKNIFFLNIQKKISNFEYLNKITDCGIDLFNKRKINFLINMPLNKSRYLGSKFEGFTEFFSYKIDKKKTMENMLLYNKNFSVCPLTTHVEIRNIEKLITKKRIVKTVLNIKNFFTKNNKKINIEILGLNPHAGKDFKNNTIEKKIIMPAIKTLNKSKKFVSGPKSADTAFEKPNGKVYLGMYHDQVLIPFKTINKFDGINITIGKKLIRMSPDHGTGENIKAKNKINNKSFLNCINFCETY